MIRGKVLQGLSGCDRYKAQENEQGCFISAFDPASGKLLWRFNTIARSAKPGGDTWGELPNMLRAGGETWITGSYDPELNLTYWGVAQAKPWMQVSRGAKGERPDSTRVRRWRCIPTTERSPGTFQHVPGETLDMDEVYERVLVDIGDPQGCVHDRQSRHPLEARPPDRKISRRQGNDFPKYFQRDRQETGKLTYRPDILSRKSAKWIQVCPSTEGGHNWQAMSYDPAGGS